eukprot:tig00021126_g18469.t1
MPEGDGVTPLDHLPPLRTAEEVERVATVCFGAPRLKDGVIHPTAVWKVNPATDGRPYGSEYATIRICEHSPPSDHDFFLLNYTRAFADGIIISGAILREEPRLRYALAGPAAEGLLDWRVRTLGKTGPQLVLVLTRGQDPAGLLSHAMFTAASDRPIVFVFFCPAAAAPRLEAAAAERELRHVRVVGAERPSIAAAVAYLRAAGPSTSRELHAARAVDTLLLSVVDPALAFVPRAAIDDAFALASAHRVASPRGETWEIRRYEAKR